MIVGGNAGVIRIQFGSSWIFWAIMESTPLATPPDPPQPRVAVDWVALLGDERDLARRRPAGQIQRRGQRGGGGPDPAQEAVVAVVEVPDLSYRNDRLRGA